MAKLHIEIDNAFLNGLRKQLRQDGANATDLVRDALTAYYWAAEERAKGRVILSVNHDGSDPARLVMPQLEYTAAFAPKPKAATASVAAGH